MDHYQKAIDILYNQLGNKQSHNTDKVNAEDVQQRQTIAKALVAMTEIWLTDLWYVTIESHASERERFSTLHSMEEDAEKNCESLLNLALQADPQNSEVLQSMASVRMSQQRPDEARTYVEQAWSLWKDVPTGTVTDESRPVILITTCV